jgi:hypothetical protein
MQGEDSQKSPSDSLRWARRQLQARPYEVKPVPQVNFQNSQRIFDLMRAGQLYLSFTDAIALALENNLDIDLERYLPRIAQTDVPIRDTLTGRRIRSAIRRTTTACRSR